MKRRALQVCTNDHPPFALLCLAHDAALRGAGFDVETVFLARPTDASLAWAHYLDVDATPAAIRGLRARYGDREFALVITHRHRPYWAVQRALRPARHIALAHEFGFFERRRRRWQHRLLARTVRFAGVSPAVAAELESTNPAIGEALVIPNVVDVASADATRLSREAARAVLGLSDDEFVVGVVGRLHPKKRPDLALRGFAAALGSLPASARLAMVGGGELAAELRDLAGVLNISDRIVFTGVVPNAGSLMAAFDVLLLTSGSKEAFGMVLLEAMLAGITVVAANQVGPRSVMGGTGHLFSGDDPQALAAALNDAAREPEDAATPRARVEAEYSVEALTDIYRQVGM